MNGGLLTHLLVSKELTLEEIYANMTEMLLAGVDTVSLISLFLCIAGFVTTTIHSYLQGVMLWVRHKLALPMLATVSHSEAWSCGNRA